MNAEAKFVSSVMDARLKKVRKERDSFRKQRDELINDIAQLRERNAELERKLDKEIKLSYEIEKNLYDTSKERDELINDMAEVKRKARAFEEIKEAADNEKLNGFVLYDNDSFIDKLNYVFNETEAGHER
ncbi:hypothetical protein K4S27_06165 [Staphylococcus epidermidis]|nr:hypothetical protein [Staphylococcus epidermidis]MCG2359282.1 hypothetical protein [Staphylococcus epidermidis]MCG2366237.1 hypothetical protein [Staphylococcus epidermidis]MCG2370756.1 hypothetical protein [Staphylococcus epidermidis]